MNGVRLPAHRFSFSGLKTKVRQTIENLPSGNLKNQDIADLCASFQAAAGDVLVDRTANAIEMFREHYNPKIITNPILVVAGGVAANQSLRDQLQSLAKEKRFHFIAPPYKLCTDNAAMIAWAGIEKLCLGDIDDISFKARPRWPLDPNSNKLE